MLLGKRTDTGDITGTVLDESAVPAEIDEAAVRAVLGQFVGEGMQVPPMYSAVKINGQPLYKAARKGQTVERKARPIVIHSLSLTERVSDVEYRLQIHCGKGTYVRVLIEDIGKALGVPATMSALRRTMASGYTLEQAHTFEQIQAAKDEGRLETLLLGIETVFAALDAVRVTPAQKQRLLNGAPVSRVNAEAGEYRIYCEGEFLGVGIMADGELRQKKLFCERE